MHKLIVTIIASLMTTSVLASSAIDCTDADPGYVSDRYIDQNDGTVQDKLTGLIWQRCEFGTTWNSVTDSCDGNPLYLNWPDALTQIVTFDNNESAAGKTNDWRMPNIKELSSIVDLHCANMAIDESVFFDTGTTYWTSTPYVSSTIGIAQYTDGIVSGYNDENGAWSVNFTSGVEQGEPIYSSKRLVRLVRGFSQPPSSQ